MSYSFKKESSKSILYSASLIKLLTALVARKWIHDEDLQDTVIVDSTDMYTPTTAKIRAGDVITWENLFYGLLVPSGNDASLTIGRVVGGMILESEGESSGDGVTRFLTEMNLEFQRLGFTDAVAGSTHGVDTETKMSPEQVSRILILASKDPFLKKVMGTMRRVITITGANARTYPLHHTIEPYLTGKNYIPEFVCGKTGTIDYATENSSGMSHSLAVIWRNSEGLEVSTVVLAAPTSDSRYEDVRKIIGYEKLVGLDSNIN